MPNGNLQIGNVSGNVTIQQAGSNIIAGNQAVLTALRQQAAQQTAGAPYKFLASYDIPDRDIFFGRDAVIEDLAGKIPRYKTLLINGRSGSGKTSLLHAGVIPRLADKGYLYLSFRDYTDPLRQLRDYMAQDDLFRAYAEHAHSLALLLKTLVRQQPQPVVLIFDQFERFFVNVRPALRTEFIQEVKACLGSTLSSAELNLVFAVREDFFGALATEFETLIPTFLNDAARVNLRPLRREEARDAILRPLKNLPVHIGYNLRFVDEVLLPGLIGESAGGERIDPPHLQIVCNQLYQAVRERCASELAQGGLAQIDQPLYAELGETRGILRTYLDEVLERAAQREAGRRDVLRSMLKVMVESTGTRKFVALPDLRRGLPDVPAEQLEEHLRQLQLSRILETRVQDATVQYSLSHEVLVEKVQSWCDERELERKKAQETLERGLAEWQSSGALLNAKQAAHIRQWLAAEQLDEQAEELLNASQQAYQDQQRKEAEQARRMRSIKRIIWSVAALALVVAAGLTTWAVRERKEAQKQAVRANELADIADQQADKAEKLADIAKQQALEAKRQARLALIRSLVAYALQDNAQEERERAALLARHAYLLLDQNDPDDVRQQIEDALRTIFHTASIQAGPGYALRGPALSEHVCQQVKFKKALTQEEWEQLAGPDIPYQPACPQLKTTDPLRSLRSEQMTASDYMALSLNIFDAGGYGKAVRDVKNRFQEQGEVIFDAATGLTWQKSVSPNEMTYTEAQKYVESLNQGKGFAGSTNWRLPTVEELLSLLEPEEQSNGLRINPVFDTQPEFSWYWSADFWRIKDESSSSAAWVVRFTYGHVDWYGMDNLHYVRVVHS